MMDDKLRPDLLAWLAGWEERADMCIALGTSLCGMNADRIFSNCAQRFPYNGGGLVVVGLQRTVYDSVASLRIWGLCDDVLQRLCKEMDVPCPDGRVAARGKSWVAKHPHCTYNTPTRKASDPV